MIDFPDTPAIGEVYDLWTWDGTMWAFSPGSGGGGSGFTFVQDTAPVPLRAGDTWFDTSTAASGGTSWVAIEEGAAGSEKVWVQFAPGQAASNWNQAWGFLSRIQLGADVSNGGSASEVAIMYSANFSSPPGRRLRISVLGVEKMDVAGIYHMIRLRRGVGVTGVQVGGIGIHVQAGVGYQTPFYVAGYDVSDGVTTNYSFTCHRTHGSGTMTFMGPLNNVSSDFIIEDIGPEVRI